MSSEKRYNVSMEKNENDDGYTIWTALAQPSLGEIGRYTAEELAMIIETCESVPFPKIEKTDEYGMKTYEEFHEWRKQVNTLINKQLNK